MAIELIGDLYPCAINTPVARVFSVKMISNTSSGLSELIP